MSIVTLINIFTFFEDVFHNRTQLVTKISQTTILRTFIRGGKIERDDIEICQQCNKAIYDQTRSHNSLLDYLK